MAEEKLATPKEEQIKAAEAKVRSRGAPAKKILKE